MNPMKTPSNRPALSKHRARLPRHDCGNTGHTGTGPRKFVAPNRWDSLIQSSVQNLWPEMDWRLIKCQVRQESAFNPRAVSPCGAIGLMQIMPATGQSLGVSRAMLFDPEENIQAGIIYLKRQYDRFPEIADPVERLKFALAAYNGGRGYSNRAIALARKEDAPWQTWEGVKQYLGSADCSVSGKHPDHRQIIAYVDRIWADYTRETAQAGTCMTKHDPPFVFSPPSTERDQVEGVIPVISSSNRKGGTNP
ncbi:MAG: transglycosylase SLT domain-containing protein [Pseudomonadota bacterium]